MRAYLLVHTTLHVHVARVDMFSNECRIPQPSAFRPWMYFTPNGDPTGSTLFQGSGERAWRHACTAPASRRVSPSPSPPSSPRAPTAAMAANTFSLSEFLEACIRISEVVTAPDERMDAASRGKEAVRRRELASRSFSLPLPTARARKIRQDPLPPSLPPSLADSQSPSLTRNLPR